MNTLRKMFSNRADKVLLGLFIFIMIWLAGMQTFGISEGIYNNIFATLQGLLPLFGAIVALKRMEQWGGYNSKLGKAIFFMALGIGAWAIGELIWSYYNIFAGILIPYPSIADLSFVLYYPFFGAGIILLTDITTVREYGVNSLVKIYSICIPIVMAILTYYFVFLQAHGGAVDLNNPLKTFIDIAYPMGDIAIIVILVLRTGFKLNFIGQRLKITLTAITLGIFAMYISDFIFTYSTTDGSYYVGAIADWLYTITLFLMSLGLSNLHPKLLEDKE